MLAIVGVMMLLTENTEIESWNISHKRTVDRGDNLILDQPLILIQGTQRSTGERCPG